jgi:hypothetical protein
VKKVGCGLGSGKVVPDPKPTCQKKSRYVSTHNTGHKVGEGEQKAALNFKKGQRRELGKWD